MNNTIYVTNLPPVGLNGAFAGVTHFFSRIGAQFRREMEMRTAIAELQTLDDRCLDDIGICRSDIKRVVRG